MRLNIVVFLLVCFVCSCASDTEQQQTKNSTLENEGFTDSEGNDNAAAYRCYRGTIAGRKVVLNVNYCAGKLDGSYYYEHVGIPIEIDDKTDTTQTKNAHLLIEYPPGKYDETGYWVVNIKRDSLTGVWQNADRTISHPIKLSLYNAPDLQIFSIATMKDSVSLVDSLTRPLATASYQVLVPIKNTKQDSTVRAVIMNSLGSTEPDKQSMFDCMQQASNRYLKEYRTAHAELKINYANELSLAQYSWLYQQQQSIIYNEHNIVVVRQYKYEYTGGAHGSYSYNYINIDRNSAKVISLQDLLTIDTTRLISLLEVEARKHFRIEEGHSLEEQMFVERLFIPKNFFITNKGITFSYGLYEIASYADGIVELFIPYNKIPDLLNPDFKQRMNLEQVAINTDGI